MLALALSWSVAAILGLVIVRDSVAARPSTTAARAILASRSRSRQPSLPPGCRLLPPGVSARRGGRHASRIPVGRDQDRVRRDAGRSSRAAGAAPACVPARRLVQRRGEACRRGPPDHRCTGGVRRDAWPPDAELLVVIGGDRYHAAAPTVGFFPISVLGMACSPSARCQCVAVDGGHGCRRHGRRSRCDRDQRPCRLVAGRAGHRRRKPLASS